MSHLPRYLGDEQIGWCLQRAFLCAGGGGGTDAEERMAGGGWFICVLSPVFASWAGIHIFVRSPLEGPFCSEPGSPLWKGRALLRPMQWIRIAPRAPLRAHSFLQPRILPQAFLLQTCDALDLAQALSLSLCVADSRQITC